MPEPKPDTVDANAAAILKASVKGVNPIEGSTADPDQYGWGV